MRVRAKTKFVGCRMTEQQVKRLFLMSLDSDSPGNLSQALRRLVDQAPVKQPEANAQKVEQAT